MVFEEFISDDGLITVDYMKGHIPEERTNKIWCHPHFEFMLIVKGDVTYSDKKGVTRVTDKSAVFIKSHEVHNPFVHSQLYERYRVKFYSNFSDKVLREPYNIDNEISVSYKKGLSDGDFNEIFAYIKNLFNSLKSKKEGIDSELRQCMHLISALIKGDEAPPRSDTFEKNYISDVVEYIKNNYRSHLTAEELAARFFVSRGKLIYDFKAYCDMTLLEYLTLTRLEAAKELLLSGYSVSYAAENCGFSSPSYFIKVFSGITGMTPLKFQTNFCRKD